MPRKNSKSKLEEPRRPPREPQTRYFRAVIQAEIPEQMQVLEYLQEARPFEFCYILHFLDTKHTCADDEQADEEVVNEDGTVRPHYHMICRVPKKITEKTMNGRFGNYLHFQRCTDPYHSALYLTHERFDCRDKHKYPRDLVEGDLEFYRDLLGDASDIQIHCEAWADALHSANWHLQSAFYAVMKSRNKGLIRSIMSHSYFYKSFFFNYDDNKSSKQGGEN